MINKLILMCQYDSGGQFVRFGWYSTSRYCLWHSEHPWGRIILDCVNREALAKARRDCDVR